MFTFCLGEVTRDVKEGDGNVTVLVHYMGGLLHEETMDTCDLLRECPRTEGAQIHLEIPIAHENPWPGWPPMCMFS